MHGYTEGHRELTEGHRKKSFAVLRFCSSAVPTLARFRIVKFCGLYKAKHLNALPQH